MTTAQIQALLQRYEAAETSLDEERQLRNALATPNLDPSLLPYRQWFTGLDAIASVSAKPQTGPWEQAQDEQVLAKAEFNAGQPKTSTLRVVHRQAATRQLWTRIAVAALVLVVFGAGLWFWRQPTGLDTTLVDTEQSAPAAIDWSKYEITDPAEAARVTRAALVQVSTHLTRGSELTAEELGRIESIHLIVTPNRKS